MFNSHIVLINSCQAEQSSKPLISAGPVLKAAMTFEDIWDDGSIFPKPGVLSMAICVLPLDMLPLHFARALEIVFVA